MVSVGTKVESILLCNLHESTTFSTSQNQICMINLKASRLTPKGLESIFLAVLKFGQAIVDTIFVQKISNFW
jgi:hypothetical protein